MRARRPVTFAMMDPGGPIELPVLFHRGGLAVVQFGDGSCSVTHLASGLKIGHYESAASARRALLAALPWADWERDASEIRDLGLSLRRATRCAKAMDKAASR